MTQVTPQKVPLVLGIAVASTLLGVVALEAVHAILEAQLNFTDAWGGSPVWMMAATLFVCGPGFWLGVFGLRQADQISESFPSPARAARAFAMLGIALSVSALPLFGLHKVLEALIPKG